MKLYTEEKSEIPIKLYTEEQVRESFKSGFRLAMETDGGLKEGQEEYINSLTPIELPSDEEIDGDLIFHYVKRYESTIGEIMALKIGAKWMRNKILNK